MAESTNKRLTELHRLVENGSLDDLRRAVAAGADVNAPGHCGTTPLMVAIHVQDLDKLKLLLEAGADPELTDDFNATALRVAVYDDFPDAVRLLLELGVDRGLSPKYPLKEVNYDYPWTPTPIPEEMKAFWTEQEWLQSQQETLDSILEMGLDPTVEPLIKNAESLEVLRMFLAAGDDLNLASKDMKRAFVGLPTIETIECSLADYRRHKERAFGGRNPERMDHPFWRAMIRTGGDAYSARQHFGDTDSLGSGAVWCYDRYGSSLTQLPDGRFVQIGGSTRIFTTPISAFTTM